jgi:Astacin (Peptidase family M12A)
MGKIGGQQDLSLQKNGCFSRGTIIHEFIHALGYGKLIENMNSVATFTVTY